MAGHDEDRDLYGDPFKITAPPPGGPEVDTWHVLAREDGVKEATVRLFVATADAALVRLVRHWNWDAATGPVLLWNERTGEVVY